MTQRRKSRATINMTAGKNNIKKVRKHKILKFYKITSVTTNLHRKDMWITNPNNISKYNEYLEACGCHFTVKTSIKNVIFCCEQH
jgi:hypothetical protein